MHETTEQIRNFLQFITLQFISHPDEAQLMVSEVAEGHIRFRLVLNRADVAILIGRNGFTASAIRNVLKSAAIRDGIKATLQIVSVEEEKLRLTTVKSGESVEQGYEEEMHDETDDDHLEEA